jgi:hypothetical protein
MCPTQRRKAFSDNNCDAEKEREYRDRKLFHISCVVLVESVGGNTPPPILA